MADEKNLDVFFIPFFASGHMIPMADLAALFSKRPNVVPTMCLTPANAAILENTLDPSVKVLTYPFPSDSVGLPCGIENLSSVSSPEQEHKIYAAVDLCEPIHRQLLLEHRPNAIVADIPFHWTTAISQQLNVPRLTWHAVGVFPQVVMNSLHAHAGEIPCNGTVTVKDLPGKEIRMPVNQPRRSSKLATDQPRVSEQATPGCSVACLVTEQAIVGCALRELPEFVRKTNFMTMVWEKMKTAQLECYGTVVNTFRGLEPEYCDWHRETDCKQAWFVGPVALARGYRKNDEHECMKWLDGKEEGSVVFVCFGSWCQFTEEQLNEIGKGLEGSRRPFLWAVRDGKVPEVDSGGMVVRGWVPQVAVLEHRAVGAFLTHCGWNSVLEALAAGKPMLTWPLVFEQFINERLMVQVVEVGKRVFDGSRSTRDEEKVIVPASTIAKVVSDFMEEEGEGGRRRRKAKECAETAKVAVAEGGSSWTDLNSLIDGLKKQMDTRPCM